MSQNKIPEIVILSECSKEYKVGFELYKAYTGDTNFESPRDIHPTKNMTIGGKEYKIHFFAIQDSYWPAISNICRYCDGAVFAIDIEDYTQEGGVEFIKEWLINLDDLDKLKEEDYQSFVGFIAKILKNLDPLQDNMLNIAYYHGIVDIFRLMGPVPFDNNELYKWIANAIYNKNDYDKVEYFIKFNS